MSVPKRRIGGSDIAKLLGLSPYGGPLEVYRRIVEEHDEPWNPRMERGAAMEPALRAHGQRMFGFELEDRESDIHAHPELDFAWAQIDDLARWDGQPVVVDYKSTSEFAKGWGADGTDDVPEHYRCQMAWELLCSDRELGLLVTGFGRDVEGPEIFQLNTIVTYQIQRDPVFESLCVQTAKDFWLTHVLPRIPPASTPIKKKRRAS